MVDLVEVAVSAGASATEIPRNEGWALLQSWREIYCAPVHAATGKWISGGGPSWHTFSQAGLPRRDGYEPWLKVCHEGPPPLIHFPVAAWTGAQ